MTDLTLIRDLGCVWLAALIAGFLCSKFKQPIIAGYVLAGVAIGPYGAALINNTTQIETLSELGVALLLFALGLEVSFRKVVSSGKNILFAALSQLILTTFCAWIFALVAGLVNNNSDGFVFGAICALSSTVVATKVLMERGEADSAYGQLLVAMLLIQDIGLVPIMALLPALSPAISPDTTSFLPDLFLALCKASFLIAFVLFGATKIVPKLLKYVTRTNSREIFLLSLIALCIGIAWSSKEMGLSLALGAFLAGAMISESPYGHQALADLLSVKDLFSTVFFVSVGMLLDPLFIWKNPLEVIVFVVLILFGKAIIGLLSARLAVASWISAILVGVGLAQIGEFSFVLATVCRSLKFLPDNAYDLFLAGAVITLIVSPMLMSALPRILWRYALKHHKTDLKDDLTEDKNYGHLNNHVIICGYGRIGRNVGIALKSLNIPLLVIDINGKTIDELHEEGIPSLFGDVFGRHVLLKAGLNKAAALVLTVPDPIASITLISFARHHNQEIKIIARAHRSEDIEIFRATGANAVVQPEFEASIEITRLALLSLKADKLIIQKGLNELETERYRIFQHDLPDAIESSDPVANSEAFSGNWFAINDLESGGINSQRTIGSLDIRNKTGATILAIKRGTETIAHPPPEEVLAEGDALYVAGNDEQLQAFEHLLKAYRFCPNIES